MEKEVKTKIMMQLMESVDNILDWMEKIKNSFSRYVSNMDGWVKEINKKISEFKYVKENVEENNDNIQHNYNLIYELKDQIEELKQEINALKLIQIISLKKEREFVRKRIEKKDLKY